MVLSFLAWVPPPSHQPHELHVAKPLARTRHIDYKSAPMASGGVAIQRRRFGMEIIAAAAASAANSAAHSATATSGDDVRKLRADFLRTLLSRRNPAEGELIVMEGEQILEPIYQGGPTTREAMESCPKEVIEDFQDKLHEENLILITEEGEQGRLPVLILSLRENEEKNKKKPAVVFLHSSYKTKEWVRPLLEAYASRGYVAVAIDSRYHGQRARSTTSYIDALISAWKNGDTMPFLFDTVFDLIKLGDYLSKREDIDPARIGITGESLGGMHAWLAASIDTRYSVIVPIIGAQGFRWALDNDKWQARADSIGPLFIEASKDLGKSGTDKEVVERVWDRIAPGLASEFDSPSTIPAITPRPLLILNGAKDPRCPLSGLSVPVSRATEAYKRAGFPENFKGWEYGCPLAIGVVVLDLKYCVIKKIQILFITLDDRDQGSSDCDQLICKYREIHQSEREREARCLCRLLAGDGFY